MRLYAFMYVLSVILAISGLERAKEPCQAAEGGAGFATLAVR